LEIAEEHLQSFRRGLAVERLVPAGVDPQVVERLTLFGYEDVASVASLSKKHLKAQFGERGTRLYDRLHPSSKPSVSAYSSPPTIEERRRFERPQRQVGALETAIDLLIEEAVAALGQRTTQRLTLRLDCRQHGQVQGVRILREPETREAPLKSISHTLLKQQLSSEPVVEEVAVVFGALGQQGAEQGTLFFERPGVRRAVRRVHRRHPGILRRARLDHRAVFHEDRITWESALAGEEAASG
jgi:nucleotidyltransferase/DNA polymerase involved in DNA repair